MFTFVNTFLKLKCKLLMYNVIKGEKMAVNISIISACNNNCDYCFQRNSYHNSGDMLSYEEIENILKWSKGAPIVRVLGGEATLHPDIIKINQKLFKTLTKI